MGRETILGAGVMVRESFLALLLCLGATAGTAYSQQSPEKPQAVVVVVGAQGDAKFGKQFQAWADAWQQAAGHTQLTVIGLGDEKATSREQLRQVIADFADDEKLEEVWLVLMGHGTFDGKRAKFNLAGPDVAATELQSWLLPVKQRTVILNCASSSSPFINLLSGKNRIVVTATRNGYEYNFARFGKFLVDAIDDPAVDLDKDGQTSVLEAFCAASREVADFYQQEKRVASEHALIDDNGDKRGTPATWFEGVRVVKKAKSGMPDGLAANQVFLKRSGIESSLSVEDRNSRDKLESQLEELRSQKAAMDESEYLKALEPLMVRLATLYSRAESSTENPTR